MCNSDLSKSKQTAVVKKPNRHQPDERTESRGYTDEFWETERRDKDIQTVIVMGIQCLFSNTAGQKERDINSKD